MKKILIVDDDANVVDYLTTLFEDNGYDTCSAGDAREAFAVALEELPDLITLDLEMPGEWGLRFYRRMMAEKQLKNIPVIVITGFSDSENAVGKAVASLTKPFDRKELLQIVEETLR